MNRCHDAGEYSIVIIKPDSVRDGLENNIVRDLAKAGFEIIWSKYRKIEPSIVPVIYPKEIEKETYPSTVKAITFGPSLLMIVRSPNVYTLLAKAKGKMDKGGIRHKYCMKTRQELIEEGYSGERLRDRLAENRLHTADTLEETVAVLSLCLSVHEMKHIKRLAPDLYERLLNQ